MKYVRMVNIGGMEVGTNDKEFEGIYEDFSGYLYCLGIDNKRLYKVPHVLTLSEYNAALDGSKKFDNYLEIGAQDQLEFFLYESVKKFDIYVQYAYEFLQDTQSIDIREIEDSWLGGRDTEAYFNKRRKRGIDMKLVLRTHSTYVHAYRDTICKLRFKLSEL